MKFTVPFCYHGTYNVYNILDCNWSRRIIASFTVGFDKDTAILMIVENMQRFNILLSPLELHQLIHLLNSVEEMLQEKKIPSENIGCNLL